MCNLSEWVHQHRREYYDHLLRVSSHGEWEPWLRFFLTALAEQADLDLHRAARIVSLFHTYRDLLTRKRKSVLLLHLLDQLFRAPAITIPIAAKHLDVSYTAAQRHIEFLLTEKILEQVGSAPYGKIYVAMDIVRAIQGHDDD